MIFWWAWLGVGCFSTFFGVIVLGFLWEGLHDDGRDRDEADYD